MSLYAHVVATLWTEEAPPWEYVTLYLCRDVYHIPPSELAKQPIADVVRHLKCIEAEGYVSKLREHKGGSQNA